MNAQEQNKKKSGHFFLQKEGQNRWFFAVSLLALLLMAFLWFCFWANKKEVWFCDEVYTYQSANGIESSWPSNQKDTWLKGADITEYLAADRSDLLLPNISATLYDDHVPLYFWIFRMISVWVFKGSASKWIGLSLNLVCYLAFIAALYVVLDRVFRGYPRYYALIAAIFCGMGNCVILEQATMLRMYMLMLLEETFLLVLANLILQRATGEGSIKPLICCFVILYFVSLAGFLTHYHFWVFYAAVAGVFCLYLLICFWREKTLRKKLGLCIGAWVGSFLLAIISTVGLFRYCIWNLNRDKGKTALGSVFVFSRDKLEKIGWGFTSFSKSVFGDLMPAWLGVVLLFAILGLGIAVLLYSEKRDRNRMTGVTADQTVVEAENPIGEKSIRSRSLILTICSAILYQLVVCFTLPAGKEVRYLWGSHTILLFCFIWCVGIIVRYLALLDALPRIAKNVIAVFVILGMLMVTREIDGGKGIFFLKDAQKNTDALEMYSDLPWVVFDYEPEYGDFSYFDFTKPEKICFAGTVATEENGKILADLTKEETFLLYCREERMADWESWFGQVLDSEEKSLSMAYQVNPVTKSTYYTVYRVVKVKR